MQLDRPFRSSFGLLLQWVSSKQSHDATERRWRAENEPDIVVDFDVVPTFSRGGIMRDQVTYTQDLPDAYDPPWPVVVVTVRNKGHVPVTIKQLVLRLARESRTVPFQGKDLSPYVLYPRLPAEIPAGHPLEANIDPREVKRMLELLRASPSDYFTIDALNPLDDAYSSRSIRAATHLEELPVMRRALAFPSPVTVGPLIAHGPVSEEELAEYRRKNARPQSPNQESGR